MTRSAAEALKTDVIPIDVRSASDIEGAFQTIVTRGGQGFIFYPIPLQDARIAQLSKIAVQHRLPWLDEIPRNATLGTLLGYGAD